MSTAVATIEGDSMPEDISTVSPSTELTPVVSEQTVFEQDGDELFLVARYPYQMERCQSELKVWAVKKIELIAAEVDDLKENVEIARKNGWGMSALIRAERLARKRLEFYQKIQAALEGGYCIVPNFPVNMIAVRTNRKHVEQFQTTGKWRGPDSQYVQNAQQLAVGEGEFKNPNPLVFKEQQGETTIHRAEDWQDIDFPFTTAKPQILSATARAMADKVFDEIGVLPGARKKQDPIVVGRIIDPRSTKYDKRFVTFLVAWFLETKTL